MKNKNKKINYKMLILPICLIISVNFIISLSMSFSSFTPRNIVTSNMALLNSNSTMAAQTESSVSVFLKTYDNLTKSNNVKMETKGEIKSFVTQNINILKIYDGKTYLTQNITTGFKTFATRIYQQGNKVTTLGGTKVSDYSTTWNGKTKTYTLQEFKDKFYLAPNGYFPYNISAISIVSSTPVVETQSGYSFSIDLHPEIAAKNYAQNIKKNTGLNNLPIFENITLNITVDKSFNFKTIETIENFTVKVFGLTKACQSKFHTTFNFTEKQTVVSVI